MHVNTSSSSHVQNMFSHHDILFCHMQLINSLHMYRKYRNYEQGKQECHICPKMDHIGSLQIMELLRSDLVYNLARQFEI